MAEPASNQSAPPSLKDGIYEALLVWGVLVVTILIVTFLLLCTPLGSPFKRRFLRLCGSRRPKEGYPNARDHQAHAFQFRSPILGTPAPPYEWVFTITPPPMAYMPSANHEVHTSPVLTPRFSEIPRAEACYGLGIHLREESSAMEKGANHQGSERRLHSAVSSSSDVPTLVSTPIRFSPSRPSFTSETASAGSLDAYSVSEGAAERADRHSRYRTMLLQSHENSRRALLESLSEEDRMHSLPLRTSSMTRF